MENYYDLNLLQETAEAVLTRTDYYCRSLILDDNLISWAVFCALLHETSHVCTARFEVPVDISIIFTAQAVTAFRNDLHSKSRFFIRPAIFVPGSLGESFDNLFTCLDAALLRAETNH